MGQKYQPSPGVAQALATFSRNGRWGTCVECPRVVGIVATELCPHTERYDHHLTWSDLKSHVDAEIEMRRRTICSPGYDFFHAKKFSTAPFQE